MPSGLQVWDENGNITLDVTDRVARFIGQIDVPVNQSGSIYVPEFAQPGVTPFFVVTTDQEGDSAYVYTTGYNLAWNYEAALSATYVACTIYYGVY